MMADAPVISVIIPAWNAQDCIDALLNSLAQQTVSQQNFEVIVVDNGSTDSTVEHIKRHKWVRLFAEPQPGSYRARNRGVTESKGDYLLFTDADCIAHPDWIKAAIAIARSDATSAIHAGHIRLTAPHKRNAVVIYEELKAFNQRANVAAGYAVTANLLCPRTIFDTVGPFRDDLLSGGDFEFTTRAIKSGIDLKYAQGLSVSHPTRGKLSELIAKKRRVEGGHWVMGEQKPYRLPRWTFGQLKQLKRDWSSILGSKIPQRTLPSVMLVSLILHIVAIGEASRLASGGKPYRS